MSQDQSGSDGPTPEQPSSFLADQQTRRKFLRAAVASGAAVAAVGVAGAAAASASPQLLRQLRGAPATASGQDPTTMCFESSGFLPITSFTVDKNGNTNPGTFFVWFTVHDLPAGTYNYALTSTPGGAPGDATTPFRLNDPGNNVYVFQVADGQAADCPTADPPNPTSGHNISNDFPYTTNSLKDLQVRVHIQYSGGGPIANPVQYTFTGTLTNTNTLVTYTHQIMVTANPK